MNANDIYLIVGLAIVTLFICILGIAIIDDARKPHHKSGSH